MRLHSRPVRTLGLRILVVPLLALAACGGSESDASERVGDAAERVGDEPDPDDLDLSFDLDELDRIEDEQLASIDLDSGFQCPTIGNRVVDDLTATDVVGVTESQDGCVFQFSFSEIDPLLVDTYTKDIFVDDVQASADLLDASTGGRAVDVPNALAAFVFDAGFLPENLPELPADGSLSQGRQVIGYFMGTRGVRLIAVFPDAVIGIMDGSDAVVDKAARGELFVDIARNTTFAIG